MSAERLKQLELVIATRNLEVQMSWTRFNALAVLQTAGLAAYGLGVKELRPHPFVTDVVPLIGAAVAIAWVWVIGRGHHWVSYWNARAGAIEAELFAAGPDAFGTTLTAAGSRWNTIAWAARLVALVFVGAWFYVWMQGR